ncbi:taste receptor type 1 member 2-like [Amphiprion ocellaris]|uniref:taste receptor type 1 member 2-like n=1 Tax=Amphiprion ocellaris TaxID=80972 RepID=UPI002411586E|nr:taste receptor type 1 member 2-like [Amphiprion ocellaris]
MVTATMKHVLLSLCLLGSVLHALAQCIVPASEFHLEGDYLIGGIFNIHQVNGTPIHNRPEAIDCSSHDFVLSNYRRFQLMRFAVDQINNSTNLLPKVSLGYEVFDHCSDTQSFQGILNFISVNNEIQPWGEPHKKRSTVIGAIGAFQSTQTRTVAPLFMMDLIPLVSYGAASSIFSRKQNFPSFLRTVRPNQDVIDVVVHIVKHFKWRWVAFLYIDDDYGKDVVDMFIKKIKDTEICLPYTKGLDDNTDYSKIFRQIEAMKINVIIVFAVEWIAEDLINAAIRSNVTDKVWIAGDAWSLNERLPKKKGIKSIGTVIGVSEQIIPVPGFSDFIYSLKTQTRCKNTEQKMVCGQICNCSAEEILAAEQSFSFTVYSAVYSIAHALHKALQCGADGCNGNITVNPTMVLAELKKSNFPLLNQSIRFNEDGDPMFGSYNVVFWNDSGDVQKIGFYNFPPSFTFFINSTKIQWHTNGTVPISVCSPECPAGYVRKQEGSHKCCFSCIICPNGTYINSTEDPYSCISCKDTEWSAEGSTSCNQRLVEFIPFTDSGAILIMLGAGALVGLTLAVSVLFAVNYNTPVVRSAGGPMCFLILGCLSLCSISVFFYFGQPSVSSCVLRFLPFFLFYTVCLACFVVRSFQIVCIFKIAAKIPKLHSWWIKYHIQWLVITAAFVTQALVFVIGYSSGPPKPYNETVWYPREIILSCDNSLLKNYGPLIVLSSLCSLCFIFSYMGKDLPKNYNEAKSITFCLLLLILTWIIFATVYVLYRGKYIHTINALAVLSSLYFFLLWYFLPKCYIIIFQPHKNTQQYFQGLIQSYTKTISQ